MIPPMSFAPPTDEFQPAPRRAFLPAATYTLIGVSVLVAILTKLGANDSVLERLFITNYPAAGSDARLPEIVGGEVWRLLTPIFIHFGILHLVFNLMWLRDLGAMIERLDGVARLLAFVLVSGMLSNLGQLYVGGPFFGGMSGVVYGLLGYVWMRSRFSPGSGFVLHSQTVLFMLGWFVACVVGLIPHVANTAHGVGLVIGILWGFGAARLEQPRLG